MKNVGLGNHECIRIAIQIGNDAYVLTCDKSLHCSRANKNVFLVLFLQKTYFE